MFNHVIEICLCWLHPILEDCLGTIEDPFFRLFPTELLDEKLYIFLSQWSKYLMMKELFVDVQITD